MTCKTSVMDESRELQWSYAASGLITGAVVGLAGGVVVAVALLADAGEGYAGLLVAATGLGLLLGCAVGGLTGAVLSLWASAGPTARRPTPLGILAVSGLLTAGVATPAGAEGFRQLFTVMAPACVLGSLLLLPVADRLLHTPV